MILMWFGANLPTSMEFSATILIRNFLSKYKIEHSALSKKIISQTDQFSQLVFLSVFSKKHIWTTLYYFPWAYIICSIQILTKIALITTSQLTLTDLTNSDSKANNCFNHLPFSSCHISLFLTNISILCITMMLLFPPDVPLPIWGIIHKN